MSRKVRMIAVDSDMLMDLSIIVSYAYVCASLDAKKDLRDGMRQSAMISMARYRRAERAFKFLSRSLTRQVRVDKYGHPVNEFGPFK